MTIYNIHCIIPGVYSKRGLMKNKIIFTLVLLSLIVTDCTWYRNKREKWRNRHNSENHDNGGLESDSGSGKGFGVYVPGQSVQILWSGKWYKGKILKKDKGKYFISYDGYESNWNEWVGTDRLKPSL